MTLKCGSAKSLRMAALRTSGATSRVAKRLKSDVGDRLATSSMVGAGRAGTDGAGAGSVCAGFASLAVTVPPGFAAVPGKAGTASASAPLGRLVSPTLCWVARASVLRDDQRDKNVGPSAITTTSIGRQLALGPVFKVFRAADGAATTQNTLAFLRLQERRGPHFAR